MITSGLTPFYFTVSSIHRKTWETKFTENHVMFQSVVRPPAEAGFMLFWHDVIFVLNNILNLVDLIISTFGRRIVHSVQFNS